MEARFISFVQEHQLIRANDRLALAVSGGIDSMALVHLCQAAGFSFEILHVNFQLRGQESDADEAFVVDFCRRHQIPCRVKRVDTKLYASENGLSLQVAARQLRYAWFTELLQTEFNKIATAHHLNDSAETFFINLLRGTGIAGLAGIPLEQNGIIRPLLFATRPGIDGYAADHQIAWREDASNQTDDYLRNQVRHTFVPRFTEVNPSWLDSFASTQVRLRAAQEAMQRLIVEWKASWKSLSAAEWEIPINSITDWSEPAALLWEAVKEYGFSFVVCEQLVKSLQQPQSGKRIASATHILWVDRKSLILSKKGHHDPDPITISELAGTYQGWMGTLTISQEQPRELINQQTAQVDLELLEFPLVWRSWQAGDRFQPLGMSGFKKVSDFLIDQKIPVSEKQLVSVLETRGEIVWVVGHRIDNRYKVTAQTQQRVTLTWSR
jgi:tRNA(Ile)-lysidine synthase